MENWYSSFGNFCWLTFFIFFAPIYIYIYIRKYITQYSTQGLDIRLEFWTQNVLLACIAMISLDQIVWTPFVNNLCKILPDFFEPIFPNTTYSKNIQIGQNVLISPSCVLIIWSVFFSNYKRLRVALLNFWF